MGGASSSSRSESITEVASNAAINVVSKCSTGSSNSQGINITGSSDINISGVDMNQVIKIDISCLQDAKTLTDMQSAIQNSLENSSITKSQALLGAMQRDSSNSSTVIKNIVSQSITSNLISEMANQLNNAQVINISGSSGVKLNGLKFNQVADLVGKNVQNALSQNKIISDAINESKTSSSTEQTNFISDIINSIMGNFMMMFIIVIILVLVGGYLALQTGPGRILICSMTMGIIGCDSPTPQQQAPQQQYQQYYQMPQNFQSYGYPTRQ